MNHPIIIQGAMGTELELLLSRVHIAETRQIGSFTFHEGSYMGIPTVISKTKIGEINAAIATTLAVRCYAPTVIINQGTAGAHSKELRTGDIVIGERVRYLSQFAQSPNSENDPLNPWKRHCYRSIDGETVSMSADPFLLEHLRRYDFSPRRVVFGCIGSGDVWNRAEALAEWVERCEDTLCEEMECAGTYVTANSLGVPAVGIRVISNNELLGERFEPHSALSAQELTLELLPYLSKKS